MADVSTPPPLIEVMRGIAGNARRKLWLQIVLAMVLGVTVGLVLAPTGLAVAGEDQAETIGVWLALPGQIFLALIQMIVIPLVMSSIVVGVTSSSDTALLRRLSTRLVPYFLATTVIAVLLGIGVASLIRPGDLIDPNLVRAVVPDDALAATSPAAPAKVSLTDEIVRLVPSNPLRAALDESMLQIVVLSIFIGAALLSIDQERARPLRELLLSVQELAMEIVGWAMVIAPIAVFGLLAQITIKIGFAVLSGMSAYVGTVLLGLALLLGVYCGIVWALARMAPWTFLSRIRDAQLLAFSTSSSAAVMPLSMDIAQNRLGVTPSIAQFIIPLGATVNMDGTALYQVAATVFLTQVFGIELTWPELGLLVATTVGASIGSPSTPGVGIVILATILTGVGVPAGGISLILGVDRILDMARTSVNVSGDLAASVVMNRFVEPSAPGPNIQDSISPDSRG